MAKSKYNPKMLPIVEEMAKQGKTDLAIYETLGISCDSFYRWLKDYPEFSEAYKRGKDKTDDYIVGIALTGILKRAQGYEYQEKKTELVASPPKTDNKGNVIEDPSPKIQKQTITQKQIAPDVGAHIFLLTNRAPDKWKNNRNFDQPANNPEGIDTCSLAYNRIYNNASEKMNDKFISLIDDYSKPIIVMYGGAGSGKSVASAQIIALSLLSGRNQLVIRKVAKTLRTSVFSEVKQAIYQLEVQDYFKINKTDMTITCINGYVAMFWGVDDPEKLKSIVPPKGMFNDIHIEEATELDFKDYELIDTRQRGQDETPRRTFLRFNPIFQGHWIKKNIIDSGKYKVNLHHSTCEDNKFLSQIDKDKYKGYKDTSLYMYRVYYLGEWGVLGGLIFNWEVVDNMPSELSGVPADYGQDFGYINPCATVKSYSNDKAIYADDEIYESKISMEDLAKLLKPFAGDQLVQCDNEDPRAIATLKLNGIKAIATKKGKGSVVAGIRHIETKKLYVNRRCVNLIKELTMYQWAKDKNGDDIETPDKTPDHAIDALRYSQERKMLGSRSSVGKI